MLYRYEDDFITSWIESSLIEDIEAKQYNFVLNKLKITDDFYKEKIIKCLVYMEIAKQNLETEGMKAKYDIYKAEYEHYLSLAKNNKSGVFNISIARG